MNLRSFIAAAIFIATSSVASAQVKPATLPRDNVRIRQGVRSGELTRTERSRLKAKEAGVKADQRAARADGVVTPGEHREIRKDKRNLSRSIYRQKHDAQVRP